MTERSRGRVTRRMAALLVAILLVYVVSPYLSFALFTRAIRQGDRTALESSVDFRSVRQSLKDELRGRVTRESDSSKKGDALSGFLARVAPALVDQLVEAFVTPEGLAALMTDPSIARSVKSENPEALAAAGDRRREVNWSRVRQAHFTGLRDFTVIFEELRLDFRFSQLHWRLKKVHLPPAQ